MSHQEPLHLPDPLIFRRRSYARKKLTKGEKASKAPYLMVPRFFDLHHPITSWLISTVVTENEKELDRVLADKKVNALLRFVPDMAAIQLQRTMMKGSHEFVITKAKYFQILDRPEMYDAGNSTGPLFHRHAVMYLTPLGLAIYLRKPRVARKLLEYINRDTNKKHMLARQPQFVTHVKNHFGDIMFMYDHNLAMMSEAFDILNLMLVNKNWFPMEPFQLVYRKHSVESVSAFDDFLDYAFYLLLTKRASLSILRLAEALLQRPSDHFVPRYLSQPSRAMRFTLIRDAGRVINNCKSYPRRLVRCAFYADKAMKSTLTLINAAEAFANHGVFQLPGDPVLPFSPKQGRRKRLEALQAYKFRSRYPHVHWPSSLHEFDCDCCVALLCGLMHKCCLANKVVPFQAAMRLATRLLADNGWLDYFSQISDMELRDYFMGLDDAEKLRIRPSVLTNLRECVKVSVLDNRFNLTAFFSEQRIHDSVRKDADLLDDDVLTAMVVCSADNVEKYTSISKGEKLKPQGTVIGGHRVRGEGRDDPKNRYYMDRLAFPPETTRTVMINTANVETHWPDDSGTATAESGTPSTSEHSEGEPELAGELNCSNCSCSAQRTSDSRRQSVQDLCPPPLGTDIASTSAATSLLTGTAFRTVSSLASDAGPRPSRIPVFQWRAFKLRCQSRA